MPRASRSDSTRLIARAALLLAVSALTLDCASPSSTKGGGRDGGGALDDGSASGGGRDSGGRDGLPVGGGDLGQLGGGSSGGGDLGLGAAPDLSVDAAGSVGGRSAP